MIECRLDPLVDGIGGGPEDRDLTVHQIAGQFRYFAAERLPRSVSAILSIAYEQSQGRRARATFSWAGMGAALTEIVLALFFRLSPNPEIRGQWVLSTLAVLTFTGPIVAWAWTHRADAARSQAQLVELRRLALEALETIVASPWFVPEPLDREEWKRLRALRPSASEVWERVAWVLVGDSE